MNPLATLRPRLDDIAHYETGIGAAHLRIGMRILTDDEPATITNVIHDADQRQAVVEVVDRLERRRVLYLPHAETVDVGAVRQYGITAVPGRRYPYAIHPSHGGAALGYAREYQRQHGGRLVVRDVIPCAPRAGGDDYVAVTEWADLEP